MPRPTEPQEPQIETVETAADYDENDYITILEAWMGARPREVNTDIIYFTKVEEELKLPPGTAGKHLAYAATRWGHKIRRQGNQTILFMEEETG